MLDELYMLSRHFINMYNRPHKRYFLRRHSLENKFSIIVGPRGVGKTTVIIQYIMGAYNGDSFTRKALYVPVDHFIVGDKSLYEIAERFNNLGGELLCLDEIHKKINWSGELKSIRDSFPKLKIIASGSSALKVMSGSHDLSRRAVVYKMKGLSLREFIELKLGIEIEVLTLDAILNDPHKHAARIVNFIEKHNKKILSLFSDYLRHGYFPYFLEYTDITLYHITLEQSIHTTIESDLLSIYPSLTGSSLNKLKKLLAVIAESVPFVPDMKRLKRAAEIGDERTLKTYLKYLDDGGVTMSLQKAGGGLRRMEKPEKIYLNNPNQIYAISASGKENTGSIRETFFVNMLIHEHQVTIPSKGDFLVDNKYTFEIGGRKKSYHQIQHIPHSWLGVDNIEIGIGNKIPLWLFGFMY